MAEDGRARPQNRRQNGGTLSFETEPGRGTAFTIRLPADGRQQLNLG
jgi:hypothetical protein